MSHLITGVSGALAMLVTEALREDGADVVGADVRPLPPGRAFPGEFYLMRHYGQRRMAEVFRRHRPQTLIHLGRIRGTALPSLAKRYNMNVLGTRHLLELAVQYGVKKVLVLSTYHVYGAHQHNHVLIREDAPLRATQIFPELADAVELDHAATSFLWRYRRINTVVLRPCNIVGPSLNNLISRLMRMRSAPMLLGYDPVMQFIHERDMAGAIVTAVRGEKWGVYNVTGEGGVSYSHALRLAGATPVPVPHFLAYPLVGALARWRLVFPKHLMDYFRYPTVIDDAVFRRDLSWSPQLSTVEALHSVSSAPASEFMETA